MPKSLLDRIERKLDEKSRIIRDFSQNQSNDKILQMKMRNLVEEVKIIENEKSSLVEEIKISREKCVKLEDNLIKAGVDISGMSAESEMSARKKVAILEIAELNQRQKTEHMERKNKEYAIALETAASRIVELETNLKELSLANLTSQATEDKLKNQLLESIPAVEFQKQLNELNTLRKENIEADEKIGKWKNMAELEQSQNIQLRLEIDEKKRNEELLRSMLDDSPVLDDDQSATELEKTTVCNNYFLKNSNYFRKFCGIF